MERRRQVNRLWPENTEGRSGQSQHCLFRSIECYWIVKRRASSSEWVKVETFQREIQAIQNSRRLGSIAAFTENSQSISRAFGKGYERLILLKMSIEQQDF